MRFAWEVEVLSRAVAYPNLSLASTQIGMSQPQLSRILKRVESSLGITLLDRASKRKVSWKPEAFSLVDKYLKLSRNWEADLQKFNFLPEQVKCLRIGCLEGVSEAVVEFVAKLVSQDKYLEEVDLDVMDLGDLEKAFLENKYDLIFTSRSPSKKKYSHFVVMGKQRFEDFKGKSDWVVATPFEMSRHRKKIQASKKIITKSLWMKRLCIEKLRASASMPMPLKKFTSEQRLDQVSGEVLVYMIGSEELPSAYWLQIQSHLQARSY